MKKIAIVLFVVAAALAGCSKKKANTTPTGGDTAGSAAPAGDTTGSGSDMSGSGDAGSAEGGGSAM